MSLWIDQMRDVRDGTPLRGFFIRDRAHRILAIGVLPCSSGCRRTPVDAGFVQFNAPRYYRDLCLIDAVTRLTGMTVRPLPKGACRNCPRRPLAH